MRLSYLFAALLLSASVARSDVVLTVDISDISAVKFTATPSFSQTANSTIRGQDGVTLVNFFTGSATQPISITGTSSLSMQGQGSTIAYDSASGSSLGSPVNTFLGLNFRNNGNEDFQVFSLNSPVFSGYTTLNLTGNAGVIPTSGFVGNIFGGNSNTANPLIGQFAVIPEPATTGLLVGLGGLLLVAGLRFRRARRA